MTDEPHEQPPQPLTAKQIFDRLTPYDLSRVTFQMPDGLPIVFALVDTDETGGALITLSDEEQPC